MQDTVQIRLGQADQLGVKMKLAQRIYKLSPQIASQVESIDLRCPDAPACTPRQASKDSSRSSNPRSDRPLESTGDQAGGSTHRGTARDREPP